MNPGFSLPPRRTGTARGPARRASWLPLAFALTLSACTSMAPPHQRPALPVAEHYPGAADEAAGRTSAAHLAWQDYFTDPTLHTLIRQALVNNRDLRTALLQIEEARAQYQIQRAERLPGLSAQGDGQRARTPADLSPTGNIATAGQYQAGLGLDAWELDLWGRVRSLSDAALQSYLATEQAARAVRLMLVTEVAQGYYGWRGLDERLALAQASVARHEAAVRLFNRRYEVGAVSRLDLVQARTLLTQAQSLAAQLAQARDRQLHGLTLLVGTPIAAPAAVPPASSPQADDALMLDLTAGLPSDLLLNRPDIVAAEHRLQAANARIGAARAAFFPRITLTGSLGTASSELDGLFDAGSRAWRFLPRITLPLFDGGRNQANLDLAEVRRDLSVAQYEQTIQTAFREVADALAARTWLARQITFEQDTLSAQAERVRLAQARYDRGSAAFIEVLDAQREHLSAAQQLARTRYDLIAARVALYGVLGGGAHANASHPSGTDTRNP